MNLRSICFASLVPAVVAVACGGSVDDSPVRDQGSSSAGSAGVAAGSAGTSSGGTSSGGTSSGGTSSGGTSSGGTSSGGTSSGGTSSGGGAGSPQTACAATCPGCCSADGQCRPGTTIGACGKDGATCLACDQLGFDCQSGVCAGVKPLCDAKTCATGCCDASGDCRTGDTSDACGGGGAACANCVAEGKGCVSGACQGAPPPCSPSTCAGCCDASGACQAGTATSACGAGGKACEACAGPQATCAQPGGYCAAFPACGPVTCPDGCCDADGNCVGGKESASCGQKGQACQNCAAASQECAPQGFCFTGKHCGPDNCAGCCTLTGECVAGSANDACGQYGSICSSCAGGAECKGFVCDSGAKCPAAYAGCSPQAMTQPATQSKVCSSFELATMEKQCGNGADEKACGEFLQQLMLSNAACYNCTSQFFGNEGYVRCLAAFMTPYCNHQLTCASECSDVTCGDLSCDDTCDDKAFGKGGACLPNVYGYYCSQAAVTGPGKVCDFQAAGSDGGKWIRNVAGYYCGK